MPWIKLLRELVSGLSGLNLLFLACAVVGGFLFLIRLVMALFMDGGDDLEPGMDVGGDGAIIGDSDATFQIISLQGIVGFLLIFGLTGLTMSVQMEASNTASVSVAFATGTVTMLLIGWITISLRKLDQSGEINLRNAVGEEGTVYLTIPEEGSGQARITVQNRLRVFDAVSKNKTKIETNTRIRSSMSSGGIPSS